MDKFKNFSKVFFIICILFLTIESCKKTDSNPSNPNLNKELLLGKWYPKQLDYKSLTYQADSLLIADGTNISLGIVKFNWWWGKGDTIIIHDIPNSTYVTWERVVKLTTDSLVLQLGGQPSALYRYYK